jgi:hypothetical protein
VDDAGVLDDELAGVDDELAGVDDELAGVDDELLTGQAWLRALVDVHGRPEPDASVVMFWVRVFVVSPFAHDVHCPKVSTQSTFVPSPSGHAARSVACTSFNVLSFWICSKIMSINGSSPFLCFNSVLMSFASFVQSNLVASKSSAASVLISFGTPPMFPAPYQ